MALKYNPNQPDKPLKPSDISPKSYAYPLLTIEVKDLVPTKFDLCCLTRDTFKYFHYVCDGFKDVGWGCAYRSLQTVCSAYLNRIAEKNLHVPGVLEMQQVLVRLRDKPPEFLGSNEWIGAVEIFIIFDGLYDVPCKILHITKKEDITKHFETIVDYFKDFGGLIMMGGDEDASSKCVAGAKVDKNGPQLLLIDPHYVGEPKSVQQLIQEGYIRWQNTKDFVDSSFYNLCMPLYKL